MVNWKRERKKKKKEQRRQRVAQKRLLKKMSQREQEEKDFLENIREIRARNGDAARFAASHHYRINLLELILTKDEALRCRRYRKYSMSFKDVMAFLRCTRAELNIWDARGQLRHGYRRKVLVNHKIVKSRRWFREDVEKAVDNIDQWREMDLPGSSRLQA